ncbi:hypothetical protein ACN28S_59640 [Cystobacter fuscus]
MGRVPGHAQPARRAGSRLRWQRARGPLEPSRLILVLREAGGARVGLIVDEAHEVLFLPEQALAPRPVGGGRTRRMALVGEEVFSVLEPGEVAAHGG